MTREEIIAKAAADAGISKAKAGAALASVLNSITEAVGKGDKVTLVGFGTFSVAKRAARTGRNPQTGKPLRIAAKKVPKFKAGNKLRAAV